MWIASNIFMWIISILLLIIYWCWLFITCKLFLSFSIDVYVILFYWNILMTNWLHALHWTFTDVDIFLCVKGSRISILILIIYWCWLVQNVLIILSWCLCDFLVLKHIHQWHTLHLHWSFINVDKLLLKFFLEEKFHLKSVFESFIKQWL